ncbi:hypothetical protein ACFFKU_06935 [Kineococcus gynurae]|uniref:Uncharacterized protein n=2 Tax=Kineococcus gynurae TaxID=452979 RepID=A0ABV5LWX0_9ACTN
MVCLVCERRDITTRSSLDDGAPRLARWVSQHADWICEQPDLDWRVEDLELIATDVRRAAEPAGIRRAKVGPCPHCAGTLIAWIDDQRALPGRIACDGAGHTWEREQWPLLGRIIDPTPDYLTAHELAAWLTRRHGLGRTITVERVRQWVARGHLDRIDDDELGRPRYDKHEAARFWQDWRVQHVS